MRTLVIDIGTSGVRAAVLTDEAMLTGLHHVETPPQSPAPGLVEFDATTLWDTILECVRIAAGDQPVDAVGITNQRASVLGWRRSSGEPIAMGLGWQDLRTVGECLVARATHGLPLAPNQSATKIAWLIANVAGARDADVIFGTLDSFVAWRLSRGAVHATDHSNAAVTGLTTADGSAWDAGVLDALGIDPAVLPRIVHTSGVIGEASALPGSPPIAALVGDQQASLVGQGCLAPGTAKATFGTGGMLDLFTGTRAPGTARRTAGGTFPIVAFSSARDGISYGTEAVMLSAGTCVEWLRDGLGLIDSAAESEGVAASVASTDGVAFVPALLGLGTPHWDYGARGALLGITRGTTRAHIVRAVLEGIAHRGADLLEAAETDSGQSVATLRIDGGMSRNSVFVQALANAIARPVVVSPVTEATTLGAGFLAGTAVGQWDDLGSATAHITGARVVEPSGESSPSRAQWAEAVTRTRSWIPDLSALDF